MVLQTRSSLTGYNTRIERNLNEFGLSTFKVILETGVSEGRKTFDLLLF